LNGFDPCGRFAGKDNGQAPQGNGGSKELGFGNASWAVFPCLLAYPKRRSSSMSIDISHETEARITDEARRQGVSVEALLERLMSEWTASAPAPKREPETPTVFEQGLGLFSSPEDAVLIDEVVSLAYTERRRPAKEQPLAL